MDGNITRQISVLDCSLLRKSFISRAIVTPILSLPRSGNVMHFYIFALSTTLVPMLYVHSHSLPSSSSPFSFTLSLLQPQPHVATFRHPDDFIASHYHKSTSHRCVAIIFSHFHNCHQFIQPDPYASSSTPFSLTHSNRHVLILLLPSLTLTLCFNVAFPLCFGLFLVFSHPHIATLLLRL